MKYKFTLGGSRNKNIWQLLVWLEDSSLGKQSNAIESNSKLNFYS